jgi:hypothetical protein
METASTLVRTLLAEGITQGGERSRGPLTLTDLHGAVRADGDYATAGPAISDGAVTVKEKGSGHVPTLVARNRGAIPALLVAGEHLEGARQNRVLNTSVLLPAKSKTLIPVTCVERGRWGYGHTRTFSSSPHISPTSLRRKQTSWVTASLRRARGHSSDQGAAWAAVGEALMDSSTRSGTHAVNALYEARQATIQETLTMLGTPSPGQTGVAVCIGGRVEAVDLFDRPETLQALWGRLVSGYLIEALGTPLEAVLDPAVESFIESQANAECTEHDGVGEGRDVVLTKSDSVGSALTWHGGVVHLSLFSTAA